MIFIQENAAFNQVLIYQDWHNELLNMINFILLLYFKESFFNYLNLGGKQSTSPSEVADAFRWLPVLTESTESVYEILKMEKCT